MPWHDDDPELDESEFPEPDPNDSDSIDLVPCPHCRQPIYQEAERCPECGNYISREDGPLWRPWWIIAGVLVCLAIVASWIWLGW